MPLIALGIQRSQAAEIQSIDCDYRTAWTTINSFFEKFFIFIGFFGRAWLNAD